MKRFFVTLLAGLGGFVLLGFLLLVALSWALFGGGGDTRVPDRFVLTLDLTRGVVEATSDDPFTLAFERGRPSLREIVATLHAAADDDRVAGLRVLGGSGVGGWASTQEIRDAVAHFRATGKPAFLFAESFGEFAPGQGAYYLATAFDDVVLQPSGDVGLAGLTLELPFLRGLLDRFDIEPVFEARGEYKDVFDFFERRGFSDPSREALEAVLRSLTDDLVAGIAEGRDLSADSARALLAAGPFSARRALDAGLVDALGYRDEALARFDAHLGRTDDPLPAVSVARYAERVGTAWSRGEQIALVHASGTIQRGSGPAFDPFGGGAALGANAIAAALRDATADRRTRAILLRVDSPGGSYVASDLVRREVARARAQGIPVVVSMANSAASGGYLVSTDADRIVAHPGTFTGSIGVGVGRLDLAGFLADQGVRFEEIDLGNGHGFWSSARPMGPADRAWLAGEADRVYDDFVSLVATGRGMTREAVDAVARGRVWTGRDALEAGLVDALGGYPVALAHARELAELDPDAAVHLRRFPAERTLFEALMAEFRGDDPALASGFAAEFGGGAGVGRGGSASVVLLETVRGAVRFFRLLGRDEGGGSVQTEMRPLRIPGS